MARNEVEVFFNRLTERHTDKSIELILQQAAFLKNKDLGQVDAIGELIKQETGRLRFLGEYAVEVTSTLRSKGINILEELEDIRPVRLPKPEEKILTPEAEVAEQEEKIPETLTTPDGTELGGETGKILAFLAHGGTFKDRSESATYMYGSQDKAAAQKLNSLINYVKKEESAAFKHGVRIETQLPSPSKRRQGVKNKDRAVFVVEEVDVPEMSEAVEVPEVEVTSKLQAAVLADVLLGKFETQPESLQQLGIDLIPTDIEELDQIRQQVGTIDTETLSRLRANGKELMERYLADVAGVYDKLVENPEFKDILLVLTHLTPLSSQGKDVGDQLFA